MGKKINELPAALPVMATDLLACVQDNITNQLPISDIDAYIGTDIHNGIFTPYRCEYKFVTNQILEIVDGASTIPNDYKFPITLENVSDKTKHYKVIEPLYLYIVNQVMNSNSTHLGLIHFALKYGYLDRDDLNAGIQFVYSNEFSALISLHNNIVGQTLFAKTIEPVLPLSLPPEKEFILFHKLEVIDFKDVNGSPLLSLAPFEIIITSEPLSGNNNYTSQLEVF